MNATYDRRKPPLTPAYIVNRLFWSGEWHSILLWVVMVAWNLWGFSVGINNVVCANGCQPWTNTRGEHYYGYDPAWHSPFMHLMYLTPLYWVVPGIHSLGPFLRWFFGG